MVDKKKPKLSIVKDDGPPPTHPDDPGPQDDDSGAPVFGDDLRKTDIANAEIFVQEQGTDLRYCYDRGAWLAWVGDHWSWRDAKREVERRSSKTVVGELNKAISSGASKSMITWARDSCSMAKRRAMTESAKHLVSVSIDQLDADPRLLNTPSGAVDLKAGVELNHSRGDYCTHMTGAEHSSDAKAERWELFLDQITGGSELLTEYLQRAAGYSATGLTTEQCLFVCIGTGANGKGVFLRAISEALGTYARTISAELLLAGRSFHNKRPEIAELIGVRLATANEPAKNVEMDESLIKVITGGDPVVGERKYEQPFTFSPQAKIWLACNNAPRFQSGGFSMDRRLRVIPFRQTFVGENRDDNLDDELKKEVNGILRWVIEGAKWWAKEGLGTCPEVDEATEEFKGEANPISRWLCERVVDSVPSARVPVSMLHKDYKSWTEETGDKPLGYSRFRDLIKAQGLEIVSISNRLNIVGKRLAETPEEQEISYE